MPQWVRPREVLSYWDPVGPDDTITRVLNGCVICFVSCLYGHFLGVGLKLFCPTVCLLASSQWSLGKHPTVAQVGEIRSAWSSLLGPGAAGQGVRPQCLSWYTIAPIKATPGLVASSWDPGSFPGLQKNHTVSPAV